MAQEHGNAHLYEDFEQIAGAASHELRDPLREALRLCGELRSHGPASPQLAQVSRCIEETLRNVVCMRQYAYLALDQEPPGEIALEGILRKAQLNNAALLEYVSGRITWSSPLPVLKGKPRQLELLFTHLFENGLKFNRSAVPHVHLAFTDRGDFYECVIEDNGTGMEPEFAYLVFGLFKRAEPDGALPGCGAGLAFARRIVHNHGGTISMEVAPGQGCRITLTLPAHEGVGDSDG